MGIFKNIATFLVLAVLLLAGNRYAYAQPNTGAGPYRNSWHTYRVVVGGIANTREWDITDGTDTIHLSDAMAWVDISPLSGSNADISVCFTDSVFTGTDNWYLLYREYTTPGTCVAARQFSISLTENNFYLTMDADSVQCKPEEGQVLRWPLFNGIRYDCTFAYLVTMHKEASFTINSWAFDGKLTFDNVSHNISSYTGAVVTPNGGSIDLLTDVGGAYGFANDGVFKLQVSEPITATLTEVTVRVILTLRGYVYEGVTATLTLTNGIINSGASGVTITNDDLTKPGVAEPIPALRDRAQSITFNALPPTPDIVINE